MFLWKKKMELYILLHVPVNPKHIKVSLRCNYINVYEHNRIKDSLILYLDYKYAHTEM